MPKDIKNSLLNETASYSKELNKIKKRKFIHTLSCKSELIDKFCFLAEEKKWSKTTLMNEILSDYFDRLENNKNEND